ncbi:amino acid permease [Spiroplasma tabanidicola]|uniref:Amino acid permease n=1 Tax=Spiroplasma tabanidicola TaxID=324079 RepID=A0A6I6CE88_9MOLU|nr:amino acid permease [Spiroplasma tabanidicola]QGS52442.1 amino acid permease [Spiroplasma tabanidicola]
MININKKNKFKNKVFEFLVLFSMTFGIVVGSGIYLKNSSENGVLAAAGKNPYIAIAVWIFVGVVACMMMLSYIEASSAMKNEEHSTLSKFAEKFVGRKWGTVTAIVFAVFYIPLLTTIGSLFLINSSFQAVDAFMLSTSNKGIDDYLRKETRIILEILLSIIILLVIQYLNYKSDKGGKLLQIICSTIKFIPLIMVLVGGIALYTSGQVQSNSFNSEHEPFKVNQIFAALIPVLFAFDGFIDSVTLQKDIEHKSVVAPAMLSGIIACALFYLLVTVSIFISSDDGNVLNLFKAYPALALVFKIIIVLTLITSVNAYSNVYTKVIKAAILENSYVKNLKNINLSNKKLQITAILINIGTLIFFVTVSLLVTWKSREPDYFLASYYSADTAILYVFIIYAVIIGGILNNRRTKKIEVKKLKGGFLIGVITLSLLSFMILYMYYLSLIDSIVIFSKTKDANSLIIPILWAIFLVIGSGIYYFNEFKIKKQNSNISTSIKL